MQEKKKKKKNITEGKLNEVPEHIKLKNYFEHQVAHLSIPCQLAHRQCHFSTPNAKFLSRTYK
jgi:hypothetical protein